MKYGKPFKLLLFAAVFVSANAEAQNGAITIDPTTQRYLGDESTFIREKFVGLHTLNTKDDADFTQFKKLYNIDQSYIGSRLFYHPAAKVKQRVIPAVKRQYNGVREVNDFVATGTLGAIYPDKTTDYSMQNNEPFITELAQYIAKSYRDEWDMVPRYIEPLNEPMVHANDYTAQGKKYVQSKIAKIIGDICYYHSEIGKAIRATPELKNMQIMGFASAFPEFESGNFTLWNNRFKRFIDIAGNDIDILSVHLYDGAGINNQGGRRSGSNSDAILDILQTYSYIATGRVMPIAVTEYGRLVPNQPGYPADKSVNNYEPVTNSQAVRSQLHMSMSFADRQNELVITTPFSIGKAKGNQQYSRACLWIHTGDNKYKLTERRYFFEMWKDIKGYRVEVKSSNIDVQAAAYMSGNEVYLMINNLNDLSQTLDLDMLTTSGLKEVSIKSLKIFEDKTPELEVTQMKKAPEKITLDYGQTVVITYKYKSAPKIANRVVRNKYYSKEYLKEIVANSANLFPFTGVKSAKGSGVLRVSVGRDHSQSLNPVVMVNNKRVEYSGDIIKGYDQSTRKRFFGTLEIPFDGSLLVDGDNTVSVTFPDAGGHVSSVIISHDAIK